MYGDRLVRVVGMGGIYLWDDAPLLCPSEPGRYGVVAVAGVVESWFEKERLTWDAQHNRWS